MNNLQILTLDSREVAQMLPKRHDHLVRDIAKYSEYLTDPKIGVSEFWQESSYKDITGRTLKCYLITKKGCEFIAHKMTGRKGAIFTATYINRFHEMEEELQQQANQISRHLRVNIPGNADMQKKIADIEASLTTMQKLMKVYNRYNYIDTKESLQEAMNLVLSYLHGELSSLDDIKVELVQVK